MYVLNVEAKGVDKEVKKSNYNNDEIVMNVTIYQVLFVIFIVNFKPRGENVLNYIELLFLI